jgi:hypothetical protein
MKRRLGARSLWIGEEYCLSGVQRGQKGDRVPAAAPGALEKNLIKLETAFGADKLFDLPSPLKNILQMFPANGG